MKLPMNKNTLKTATLLSIIYVVVTCFLPEYQMLLWLTALLIVINYGLSLTYLFGQGEITANLILLNLVQLVLYGRLHVQIHDILGTVHYSYNHYFIYHTYWYDWVKFIAEYVLHAVDWVDALNSYGIELQHLKPRSMLAKWVVFSMQVMVDMFLLSGIFRYFQRHQLTSTTISTYHARSWSPLTIELLESFKDSLQFIKQARWTGLKVATGLTIWVGAMNHWSLQDFWLWPLENVLRTLDFGDAFQVFDWHLHTVERQDVNVVTLAVFLRLEVSFYVLPWVNHFYLFLLRGRGRTLTGLILIAISPESSQEEQRIAINALVRFGSLAVPILTETLANIDNNAQKSIIVEVLAELGPVAAPSVSHLATLLVDTDETMRSLAARALPKITPNWPRRKAVHQAIPHLVTALQHSQKEVRLAAVRTLGRIGAASIQTVPPLVETTLIDSDKQVRLVASLALRQLGTAAASEAVSRLMKALVNGNDETRLAAAEALGNLGRAAIPAMPFLVQVSLTDWDGTIRLAAQQALKQLDPRSVNTYRCFSAARDQETGI